MVEANNLTASDKTTNKLGRPISVACKRLIHLFDLHSWGPEPNVYKNVLIHIHFRYMLMK